MIKLNLKHAIICIVLLIGSSRMNGAEPKKDDTGIAPSNPTAESLTDYGQNDEDKPTKGDKEKVSKLAVPTPQQLAFMDLELGLFIHYGMNTYTGEGHGSGKQPPSKFNPTKLDCDSWMETAKAMGAKYVVFTAVHEEGFCLWPTTAHDYSVRKSPWKDGKGDVVREFVDACRRHGLKPCLYNTASHDAYNALRVEKGEITEEQYIEIQVQKATELFSNYGPITYTWQDHHSPSEVWKRVDKKIAELQPDCLRFGPDVWLTGRKDKVWHPHTGQVWHPLWYTVNTTDGSIYGRPDDQSKKQGIPGGKFFRPIEANTAITGKWFWKGLQKPNVNKMETLYFDSVGLGANFLPNLAPDPSGKMPDVVIEGAKAFGDRIRKIFSNPLGSTEGTGAIVELDLGRESTVETVVTMEGLKTGQRIARYAIEAKIAGKWKEIASDQTVGHKKIDRLKRPVRTSRLRVVCLEVVPLAKMEDVVIRSLTAYGSPENNSGK
jgi:alpha-L-fucosidase